MGCSLLPSAASSAAPTCDNNLQSLVTSRALRFLFSFDPAAEVDGCELPPTPEVPASTSRACIALNHKVPPAEVRYPLCSMSARADFLRPTSSAEAKLFVPG